MKVSVDKETCTGCGLCVDTAPEVFELEDNVAVAKSDRVPDGQEDAVKQAAGDCPVEAIKVEE
ncbi:MAG: ferredoxin [Elusimicrobiota bacterium]